jgi:hypothetical protein
LIVKGLAEDLVALKTMLEQDINILQRAKRYGIDPRNTFRCFGVEEGDRFVIHIATSGPEGVEYAKKFFEDFSRTKKFIVENDPCKRYEFRDVKPLLDELVKEFEEELRRRMELLER